MPQPFSVEDDLVTPSMKLKRPQLQKKYQKQIDKVRPGRGHGRHTRLFPHLAPFSISGICRKQLSTALVVWICHLKGRSG